MGRGRKVAAFLAERALKKGNGKDGQCRTGTSHKSPRPQKGPAYTAQHDDPPDLDAHT